LGHPGAAQAAACGRRRAGAARRRLVGGGPAGTARPGRGGRRRAGRSAARRGPSRRRSPSSPPAQVRTHVRTGHGRGCRFLVLLYQIVLAEAATLLTLVFPPAAAVLAQARRGRPRLPRRNPSLTVLALRARENWSRMASNGDAPCTSAAHAPPLLTISGSRARRGAVDDGDRCRSDARCV
jgi:hypothetical protein